MTASKKTAPQWVPFVYPAKFREKRNPNPVSAWVIERLPVAIPEVSEDMAPLAYKAVIAGEPVCWRVVEGVLMREVLGLDGKPGGAETLEEPFGAVVSPHPENSQIVQFVASFSRFNRVSRAQIHREDLTTPGYVTESGRQFAGFVSDRRDEALARALTFTGSLRMIGGRLYRPASEPVWRVALLPSSTSEVRIEPIAAREINYSGCPHADFALDHLQGALDFAEVAVEVLRVWGNEKEQAQHRVTVTTPQPEDCVDFGVWQALIDVRLAPLNNLACATKDNLPRIAFEDLSPRLIAALGVMFDSSGGERPDPDAALAAWGRFKEASKDCELWPLSLQDGWTACLEATFTAAAREFDADDELSGLGMKP